MQLHRLASSCLLQQCLWRLYNPSAILLINVCWTQSINSLHTDLAASNPHCMCVSRRMLHLQKEASDVFFAATKLFQAKDPHLRRMVYLLIKVRRQYSRSSSTSRGPR